MRSYARYVGTASIAMSTFCRLIFPFFYFLPTAMRVETMDARYTKNMTAKKAIAMRTLCFAELLNSLHPILMKLQLNSLLLVPPPVDTGHPGQ